MSKARIVGNVRPLLCCYLLVEEPQPEEYMLTRASQEEQVTGRNRQSAKVCAQKL